MNLQYNRYYIKGDKILKYKSCHKTKTKTVYTFEDRLTGNETKLTNIDGLRLYELEPKAIFFSDLITNE